MRVRRTRVLFRSVRTIPFSTFGLRSRLRQMLTRSEASFRSPTSQTSDTTLHPNPSKFIAELDQTVVGMDFVMTLETPCLGHIMDAPPNASSGHSLMVSATVLHHQQHQPSASTAHNHGHSHSHSHSHKPSHRPRPLAIDGNHEQQLAWQMPAVGIERLLELSASVPIPDGELTPVQAWDAVRRHPQFAGLEVGRLKRLEERLLGGIKCFGYVELIFCFTMEHFDLLCLRREMADFKRQVWFNCCTKRGN
jgi:hypothetical protein